MALSKAPTVDADGHEIIPKPTEEVYFHIAAKGFQAGSLLGLLAGAPYVFFRGRLVGMPAMLRYFEIVSTSALISTFVVMPIGYAKLRNATRDDNYDRAYRLRHNQLQNRVDRFCVYGGAIGAACGLVLTRSTLGLRGGLATGVGLAIIAHLAAPKHIFTNIPK